MHPRSAPTSHTWQTFPIGMCAHHNCTTIYYLTINHHIDTTTTIYDLLFMGFAVVTHHYEFLLISRVDESFRWDNPLVLFKAKYTIRCNLPSALTVPQTARSMVIPFADKQNSSFPSCSLASAVCAGEMFRLDAAQLGPRRNPILCRCPRRLWDTYG